MTDRAKILFIHFSSKIPPQTSIHTQAPHYLGQECKSVNTTDELHVYVCAHICVISNYENDDDIDAGWRFGRNSGHT